MTAQQYSSKSDSTHSLSYHPHPLSSLVNFIINLALIINFVPTRQPSAARRSFFFALLTHWRLGILFFALLAHR
jgi:hypothetical protein